MFGSLAVVIIILFYYRVGPSTVGPGVDQYVRFPSCGHHYTVLFITELDPRLSGLVWTSMFGSLAVVITVGVNPTAIRTLILSTILRLIFSVGLEPTLWLLGALNVSLFLNFSNVTCIYLNELYSSNIAYKVHVSNSQNFVALPKFLLIYCWCQSVSSKCISGDKQRYIPDQPYGEPRNVHQVCSPSHHRLQLHVPDSISLLLCTGTMCSRVLLQHSGELYYTILIVAFDEGLLVTMKITCGIGLPRLEVEVCRYQQGLHCQE